MIRLFNESHFIDCIVLKFLSFIQHPILFLPKFNQPLLIAYDLPRQTVTKSQINVTIHEMV